MASRSLLRLLNAGVRPVVRQSLAGNYRLLRTISASPLGVKSHAPVAACLHTTARRLNEHIINIQDEEDFKMRVTNNTEPVIVDFHASWCGPCKLLGPRLESLISEQNGKVVLAKVDVDSNTDIAIEYGVEAVPTVLAMKDGKIIDKFVGNKMDDELGSFVQNLIGA